MCIKPTRLNYYKGTEEVLIIRFLQLLTEMLMGKRVEIGVACSAYNRSFSGEQSPLDLETTFQLLYRLFTHTVKPEDGDLATCFK